MTPWQIGLAIIFSVVGVIALNVWWIVRDHRERLHERREEFEEQMAVWADKVRRGK